MDNKTFEDQYKRAKEKAEIADATEPRAYNAHYNPESNLVIVHLKNGEGFSFPPAEITELAQASDEELADVEVTPSGDGLYWPLLDADLGIEFLVSKFADPDATSGRGDIASADSLNQLFAQIEIAWVRDRDARLVDQLAERHPELKDELFDFLGLLIASELDAPYSPEEVAKSIERTKKWLTEEGWALAAKTAKETMPHSTTAESQHNAASGDTEATSTEYEDESASEKIPRLGFMGLLQFRTGRPPSQIQDELKVPDIILTFAQDNPPEETPGGARKDIVDRAVKKGWVNEAEGEEALSRVLRKAAFRPTPYTHDKPGNEGAAGLRFKRYIELISNSKLKKLDKRYWLEFAKQEE